MPSPAILGETTLGSSSAALSLLITFAQTINIFAGVQYAIVVNYEGAPPPGPDQLQGVWEGASGDPYPRGKSYFSVSEGSSWFQSGVDVDLHFQTYVAGKISIDIKPGSYPNSINLKSKGIIPVALLTTNATDNTGIFDATTVDPSTVRFGSNGTEAAPVQYALEDVDSDGDTDLILHFRTQDTGIRCGDAFATLTGQTFDGHAMRGTDSITVCNK